MRLFCLSELSEKIISETMHFTERKPDLVSVVLSALKYLRNMNFFCTSVVFFRNRSSRYSICASAVTESELQEVYCYTTDKQIGTVVQSSKTENLT